MNDFASVPIRIRFTESVLGGVPKHPSLIESWIASRAKPPINGETLTKEEWTAERMAEVATLVEPTEEKSWSTFLRDEVGIFLPQIAILAFIRDMASTLGYLKAVRGVRQTLQHCMCVNPSRVRFERDGSPVLTEDDYDEHAVHVMTPQGPRTSIVRSDFVKAGAELAFDVLTIEQRDPKLGPDVIRQLFSLGGLTNGLGARRSQGFGRFEVI